MVCQDHAATATLVEAALQAQQAAQLDVVGMAQWAHHALSTRRMVYSAAHVTLLLWLPKARFQPVSTAFCHQQEEWAWMAWPWMPVLHACHC